MLTLTPIPELDRTGLRRFAWLVGTIIALLFGLALPWLLDRSWPLWPWLTGAVLATWGTLAPASLRPVYRGWMRFGMLMHRIMSPLLLGVIFFLIITPTGLLMRLVRRRRVALQFDHELPSYRIASRPLTPKSMEKPF